MDNKCYNCKKMLSFDRACISDGGCAEFEPDDGIGMTRFIQSLPKDLVNAIWDHREEFEKCLPKVKR